MKRKKNSTVSLTGSQSYFMCMKKKTSLYHYFFWSKMENKDKPCHDIGGICKDWRTNFCRGSYLRGLCSGDLNNRCCRPCGLECKPITNTMTDDDWWSKNSCSFRRWNKFRCEVSYGFGLRIIWWNLHGHDKLLLIVRTLSKIHKNYFKIYFDLKFRPYQRGKCGGSSTRRCCPLWIPITVCKLLWFSYSRPSRRTISSCTPLPMLLLRAPSLMCCLGLLIEWWIFEYNSLFMNNIHIHIHPNGISIQSYSFINDGNSFEWMISSHELFVNNGTFFFFKVAV